MRILFLTSRLPHPPDRGDRLRTNQFLRLFAREHDVTLVSFAATEDERALANELTRFCAAIHLVELPKWRSVVSTALNAWRDLPLQLLYYRSRLMQQLVDELVSSSEFDMAYVHLFRMAPYLENHAELFRVLDFTDLISHELQESMSYQPFFWRAIYRSEVPRIAAYEQQIAARFDEIWFISKHDRDLFLQKRDQTSIHVVPSSFDDAYFQLERSPSDTERLLFIGNLDVRHNIDAATFMAEQIMPLIRNEFPGCRLQIVGAGDVRNVQRLASLPGIDVVGYVPNLSTLFSQTTITVAPLRFSAGTQFKVIESMAVGIPVVAASRVSNGVGADPETHLLVADTPGEFASQISRLLHDEGFRQSVGRSGQEFVRTRFTVQPAEERLKAIGNLLKRG